MTEGTYFVSVTGKGNEDFDPVIPNTGSGATSQGVYQLKLDFKPTVAAAGLKFTIEDTSGTALDGDGDGMAGGNFQFLVPYCCSTGRRLRLDSRRRSMSTRALPVRKLVLVSARRLKPLKTSTSASGPLVVAAWRCRARGGQRRPAGQSSRLRNWSWWCRQCRACPMVFRLEVPQGVTMMIDAGAVFKLQGSRISTGSLDARRSTRVCHRCKSWELLRSKSVSPAIAMKVIGRDTNPLTTIPGPGDWGGIDFHEEVDRREGFGSYERRGIFLNYVSNADIRYGGGQITVSSPSPTVNPINLTESRPTLLNNTIRFSADAAMSADPNSFEETRFSEPRYQLAEYLPSRLWSVGPDIRGNILLNNSTNGLFVKTATSAGGTLTRFGCSGPLG